ncbi:MAG: DUF3810 domain-containing protein [Saprospiraceae bacterium]|nr:DUF3810 domain-containing protein [Saprospiraceae bacterium]
MKISSLYRYGGIFLGVNTWMILRLYNTSWRHTVFQLYDSWIFPMIRKVYSFTLYQLPFPVMYFFVFVCLVIVGIFLKNVIQKKLTYYDSILKVANGLGYAYFLFYFLWGFQYFRPSMVDLLHLDAVTMDSTALKKEFSTASTKIKDLREKLSQDTLPLKDLGSYDENFLAIAENQKTILTQWRWFATEKAHIRMLYPKGVLLRFSTAGFYWPFIGEGQIDGGLHPLQWPFTAAHELAHANGITDEGECNFIGFLTCIKSQNLAIQYSGWLGYWRYVYFEMIKNKVSVHEEMANLPLGVLNDLKDIRKYLLQYPDILPQLRDVIYESYLKNNHVTSGLQSYNQIIDLKIRYDQNFQ